MVSGPFSSRKLTNDRMGIFIVEPIRTKAREWEREKLCKYHSDLTHSSEFTTRPFPLIESTLCSRKSIAESRFVQLEWRNWLLINSDPNSSHNNILIRIELISSTDVQGEEENMH